MSLTVPWKTRLVSTITASQTQISVTDDITDVCTCLDAPSHIFAMIYTATKSERVVVTGCADGQLVITRGAFNTDASSWPATACVMLEQVVDGIICPDEDDDCGVDAFDAFGNQISDGSNCDLAATFNELNVGKGLLIDRTNPTAPVLRLAPTGVTPGAYGGAEVNECGQLDFVPLGWPSNALVDFNPCCDDTGTGTGAVAAIDVSFAPGGTNTVAVGNSVQVVLQQIDDYLTTFVTPSSGVLSITSGQCIDVTGTAANPIVSLQSSGITAGTYDGFTVNECGVITGYTAPTGQSTIVAGTAPISVAFNGTDTYTVSVGAATKTDTGVVLLADEADIGTPALIAGDSVITWDFLQQWSGGNNGIAQVEASLPGLLVTFNGTDTYDVTPAPDLVNADGNPIVVTYDALAGKFSVDTLPADIGQFGAVQLADPALVATPASVGVNDAVTLAFLEAWLVDKKASGDIT